MKKIRWALALAVLAAATAHAQQYPSKAVRMVVPFPPGGGTDVIGRLVASQLTRILGQQVVVDNRAGAAGRIGAEVVARAPSDGYTLLMATTTVIITAPALFPKLPYDVMKDLAPVAPIASGSYVLVVHPSVPARSVKDLIALALSVVMGETDLMFSNILPAIPPVRAGKLKPLGVTTRKRSPLLPDVPTVAESALPRFEVQTLYAILAPGGTAPEIVKRLNDAIAESLRAPEVKQRIEADGSQVLAGSSEALRKTIVSEIAMWSAVIRRAGIKPPE